VGGGSAMMVEHRRTQHLVRTMVDALRIPVTAKMRLGWDDENLTAPDLVRALEDAGIAGVFIHGRTREQGFSGTVNLAGIAKVVEAARTIPVIGNGDVTTPEAAVRMKSETGCAGVSVGRGAFYDPWIFVRTRALMETGVLPPEPGIEDRVRVMSRHLDLMVEVFGERHGCVMFRKIGPWYAKRFGPANEFSKRIVRLESRDQYLEIVAGYLTWRRQFCDDSGELLPRYRLAPMVASFMREDEGAETPASARREAIPVPKGPVEVW
jgi:tRNA-dihydrouridine synthase B